MKEAFGTAYVVNFVIIFVILFIFFFVAGMSYTKAFKIKNRIVDIIEENECYSEDATCESKGQIDDILKEAGYRVTNSRPNCKTIQGAEGAKLLTTTTNTFNYCVYKFDTSKGSYYKAAAFMYYEIPVIGVHMQFPVYGETKVMGEY
ncbi:MAG: hypothetical protein V8Q71_04120 [Bacilli bacterium]|jgi:hypothetical protein